MGSAECGYRPATIFPVGNQRPNADDRVVDALEEFVPHRRSYFLVVLAVMTVGSREAV
jgi:hypothetical protein